MHGFQEPAPSKLAYAACGQFVGRDAITVYQARTQRRHAGIAFARRRDPLVVTNETGQESGPAGLKLEPLILHHDADVAIVKAGDVFTQGPPPAARIGGLVGALQSACQTRIDLFAKIGVEGVMGTGMAVDQCGVDGLGVVPQGLRQSRG